MNKKTIDRIRRFSEDRDWDQFHGPANLAKSIVIEAAELLECFQWCDDNFNLQHVKEELADVLIYSYMMADNLDFDIDEIIKTSYGYYFKIELSHNCYFGYRLNLKDTSSMTRIGNGNPYSSAGYVKSSSLSRTK